MSTRDGFLMGMCTNYMPFCMSLYPLTCKPTSTLSIQQRHCSIAQHYVQRIPMMIHFLWHVYSVSGMSGFIVLFIYGFRTLLRSWLVLTELRCFYWTLGHQSCTHECSTWEMIVNRVYMTLTCTSAKKSGAANATQIYRHYIM